MITKTIIFVHQAQLRDHEFDMMTLAHDLGLDELKTACEDNVIASLSVENACKFLICAMENGK